MTEEAKRFVDALTDSPGGAVERSDTILGAWISWVHSVEERLDAMAVARHDDQTQQAFSLDSDGYPTEETLEAIKGWPVSRGFRSLMDEIKEIWRHGSWSDEVIVGGRRYRLSTGGWSGNEDILSALGGNYVFWANCWQRSMRGGRHMFDVVGALGRGSDEQR